MCTNVHRISTDVNDWNAECRNTKVRCEPSSVLCLLCVFGVRSVKIRHSCNFPVVSCTINQADAWLRQEDGFCVVYLFCFAFLPCLSAPHLSPHLVSSRIILLALWRFFFRSFSLTLSRCLRRVQDVVRNIILKRNQTKRNEIKEWERLSSSSFRLWLIELRSVPLFRLGSAIWNEKKTR